MPMKQTICSLQNVKDEIHEALEIILAAHFLPLSQVWIPYKDENQVTVSSFSEYTQTKQLLWLKLAGHRCDSFWTNEDFRGLEEYGSAHYRLPRKTDEMFVGKTLENYEPRFIKDVFISGSNNPLWLLLDDDYPCSCFLICLRSTKTGDLDYVFEFFWNHYEQRNNVILLEQLLLTLKRYLPSFKFASGIELGDEIDILDVNNSIGSENKFIKIFQRNKVSLKRGRQSEVEECLTPLKARGKTTLIKLTQEQIESQFGQTMEEAAPELKGNHNLCFQDYTCLYIIEMIISFESFR